MVWAIHPELYTAGIFAILRYANDLVERGHDVRIISGLVAFQPNWIDLKAKLVEPSRPLTPASAVGDVARVGASWARVRAGRSAEKDAAPAMTQLLRRLMPYASALPMMRGGGYERVRRLMPEADITMATSWDTVLPVHLYGSGHRVHFMQHLETQFADDYEDPVLAAAEADLGYRLGSFQRIANVSWIADRLERDYGHSADVCWPAVDHDTFYVDGSPPESPFTVLGSGGGPRRWKGFAEAAEAIRIARETIPGLRWRVYGGAMLAPDNDVASYEDLGFVRHDELRRLYSTSHVTLQPSWYEGFSYPGLEAMACGSVLVATPLAADDLARDGENAVVVPERDPAAMARALVELWEQPERRAALREQALRDARSFTWDRSYERMHDLLVSGASR